MALFVYGTGFIVLAVFWLFYGVLVGTGASEMGHHASQ